MRRNESFTVHSVSCPDCGDEGLKIFGYFREKGEPFNVLHIICSCGEIDQSKISGDDYEAILDKAEEYR